MSLVLRSILFVPVATLMLVGTALLVTSHSTHSQEGQSYSSDSASELTLDYAYPEASPVDEVLGRRWIRRSYWRSFVDPTPTPTTSRESDQLAATPTATPAPPTATPRNATATPVPPTPTPQPPASNLNAKPIPSNGAITQSGVYSGKRDCPSIDAWSYCVTITASNVVITDFDITSSGFGIGIWAGNVQVSNGKIASSNSGVAAWNGISGLAIEGITVRMTGGNAYVLMSDQSGCETLTTKRLRNVVIRNSSFTGVGGNEGVWGKCVQDLTITGNSFQGANSWHVSLPDSLDVLIEGNTFDLTASSSWAGIELPRTHNAVVRNNLFYGNGPNGNDRAVTMNSGSRSPWITGNTWRDIRTGVDLGSVGALIENNCIPAGIGSGPGQVLRVTEYESSDPSEIVRNNGKEAC